MEVNSLGREAELGLGTLLLTTSAWVAPLSSHSCTRAYTCMCTYVCKHIRACFISTHGKSVHLSVYVPRHTHRGTSSEGQWNLESEGLGLSQRCSEA